jgi:pimeloyl-ACP methyl ester carboxylesterase
LKTVILLILAVLLGVTLFRAQHRLIYFPRAYGGDPPYWPASVQALEFRTSQGRQVAFYRPPAAPGAKMVDRLWLICGGNASLALDWLELLKDFPDQAAGFLLLDYPGYGASEGRPGPEAILESTEAALAALARHLGTKLPALTGRVRLLGHSLGAAAVLLYATRHPVGRIVLVSPFTSLKDMAAQLVGPWLARTLVQNYDNRSRLAEILSRPPVPPITIIHGDHDRVVPVAMGRELAAISPRIHYLEVARADHNYILVTARAEIIGAMLGSEPGKILSEE